MPLTKVPPLGRRVIVTDKDHERSGEAGKISHHHGRLTDYVYVLFDRVTLSVPELISLRVLDLESEQP